jgi:hypothetical protein
MRTAIWAAVGSAALMLASCASAAAVTIGATTTARTVQSPQQLADADAASMLADFRPPPGAVKSGPIAIQVLSAPPEQSGTPDAVLRTAWWRVDGKPGEVLAWVRAHLADGFTVGASGSSSGPSTDQMQFDQFDLPAVPGVLTERWLLVSVAEAGSADRTAIRVDAEVNWEHAKPAGERIPATAKVVTITPVAGLRPLPAGDRPVTVTDRAEVDKIAAAVDGLPLFPAGGFFCPADFGRSMLLTFRASARGPVLAEVSSQTGGCDAVTVTIEGRSMPALWHGLELQQQVVGIVGIHWPGFFSY